MLKLDQKQALNFIKLLAGSADSVECFQPLHDTIKDKSAKRKWFYSTLKDAWPQIKSLQANGYGIFVTVNETDGAGRCAKNVKRVRAAFVDCDVNPPTWEEAESAGPPLAMTGRPGRVHFYWRALIVPGDFRPLQKKLIAKFGADKGIHDLPRVMRLPGTFNLKGEPIMHELIRYDPLAPGLRPHDFYLEQTFDDDLNAANEVNAGERNSEVYKRACAGVNRGLSEAERLTDLRKFNATKVNPPLDAEELIAVNASAGKYARGGDETLGGEFDKWAWVSGSGSFWHLTQLRDLPPAIFNNEMNHNFLKGVPADIVTRESMVKKFEGIVYEPEQPRIVEQAGRLPLLNIYRPPDIQPKRGSIRWLHDHLNYLVEDERERRLSLDWICYSVANPGKKIHFALVFQGEPGTGKSFFKQVLSLALGPHNVAAPGNDTLADDKTGWMKGKTLICIEELMFRGRLDLINKCHTYITEPFIPIREMYRESYSLRNTFNFLATTNYPDAVRIQKGDRRWFLVFSKAEPRGVEYYEELFNDLEGKAATLRWYASRHKYSDEFKPKGRAPLTQGRERALELAQTEFEAWANDAWENEAWPFTGELLIYQEVMDAASSRFKNFGRLFSAYLMGRRAESLGRITIEDKKQTVWAFKNTSVWLKADAKKIAKKLEDREKSY